MANAIIPATATVVPLTSNPATVPVDRFTDIDQLVQAIQANERWGGSRNPLHEFRSYSYQFVLYCFADMDTFNALSIGAAASSMETFLHPTDPNPTRPEYAKYVLKTLPGYTGKGNANDGKYAILINTAEDADLLINNVDIETTCLGDQDAANNGRAYASANTHASMRIFEPLGGLFLDILAYIATQFGVSTNGLFFGLKPIFVGHTDGSTNGIQPTSSPGISTVETIHIRSLSFQAAGAEGIKCSFSSSGGTYDLTLLPFVAGLARIPLYNSNKSFGVRVPTPVTIEAAVTALLNKLSQQHLVEPNTLNPNETKTARYVAWFIDPTAIGDTAANHFKLWLVDNVTSWQKEKDAVQFPPDLNKTIEQIIEGILALCSTYTAYRTPDSNVAGPPRPVCRLRIVHWVEPGEKEVVINYMILRENVNVLVNPETDPVLRQQSTADRNTQMLSILQNAYTNNNLLIYDYIFSGRNVDVLDFDLQMPNGIFALNQWIHSKNSTNQSDAVQPPTVTVQTTTLNTTGGVDLAGPAQIQPGAPSNAKDPAGFASYYQFQSQINLPEFVTLKLKILGNPLILNGIIRNPTDYQNLISVNGQQQPNQIMQVMQNWETQPGIVRINVYMPSRKFNPQTAATAGTTTTFKEQFWFKGLFQIYKVKHTFSDGKFTQELELKMAVSEDMLPAVAQGNPPGKGMTNQGNQRTAGQAQTGTAATITSTPPSISQVTPPNPTAAANLRAFMLMIRKGEGTLGDIGYRTLFGGGTFNSFVTHPNILVTKGRYSSTAAGAYQFLYKTWSYIQPKIGVPDFSPASQDAGCIFLIQQQRALNDVYAGNLTTAIRKCAPIWASLPFSPYGQPTQTLSSAVAFYQSNGGTQTA